MFPFWLVGLVWRTPDSHFTEIPFYREKLAEFLRLRFPFYWIPILVRTYCTSEACIHDEISRVTGRCVHPADASLADNFRTAILHQLYAPTSEACIHVGMWHRVPAIWSCLILLGHFRAKYTRSLNSEFLGPTLEKSWDLTRSDLLRFCKVGWLLKLSTVWGGLPAVQNVWRSQTGDHELNPYH